MQRLIQQVAFTPRQTIVLEGQPAEHVFIVSSGAASVFKTAADGRRQITGLSLPGDFIGSLCDERHCFSAEALTRAELCRIPATALEGLCRRFPAVERRLLKAMSNELCSAQALMLSLGRKSAPEKLASFLLMLAHRAKHRGEPTNPITLFMTRTDIADCLGLNDETVSRTFTQLARHGLIRLRGRRQVVLVGRDLLDRLAEGTMSLDPATARDRPVEAG